MLNVSRQTVLSTRASLSVADNEAQAASHAAGQEGFPTHADVIIVGAGVAGLATACALNQWVFPGNSE